MTTKEVFNEVGGSGSAGLAAAGSGVGLGLRSNAQAVEMVLEGERLLKAVKAVWEDHISSMRKLTQVLKYMVRAISNWLGSIGINAWI